MNVIITGASRGIGYELVKHFIEYNDCTVYAISRNQNKLNELVNLCGNLNANSTVKAIGLDLNVEEDIISFTKKLKAQGIIIDVLVNNAGLLVNKAFDEVTFKEMESMYKVNVLSPMLLTQRLIPLLLKANKPHVINISSMGGFQGTVKFPGLASYASSKAAIASLTECLAEEYKETNIKFNCLALGAVATEMLEEAFPGYNAPTTPKEMASFIHDFATTGQTYFNGKILPVSSTTP